MLNVRFGSNSYPETKMKSIFFFIKEALEDKTLIVLIVCAVVSLIFGIFFSTEKNGWIDSMGIFLAIFLVVSVSSFNNWTKEKQFRDLNRIKEDRDVKVMRTGEVQRVSTRFIQVGDIVILDTGDQVPADGILFEGFSVECDQSNLTGESEGVHKHPQTSPFMMSGTRLVDGVGNMIVTAVGLNTEWGEALAKIVDQEPEDTPLEGQLEKLADAIGYCGGAVAGLMFAVLTIKYLVVNSQSENPQWGWSSFGEILKYLVLAVALIVAAVPEGLPLAVTISLAFSVKKMLKDNNLVRNLAACETMGSATSKSCSVMFNV
jgi:Ca2+-transporting ATPase